MDTLLELTQRNADFAANRFATGLRILPTRKVFVIGCVDPRVDPAQVLGIELGEAAVIRNIGGRVTPALLKELVLLRKLTKAAGSDFDQGWNFIVLQHTGCGIVRMQSEREGLAEFLGVDDASLDAKMVGDPRAAVQIDVEVLRAHPELPAGMTSSGYVYDVDTGLIENIVPAAP